MSYQYYGKDTIALPGRTVQTFPSGLVRVEQMYAVKKGMSFPFGAKQKFPEANPLRPVTFDGLYVFPDPEVVEDEDGFTKYKVTAYGRAASFSLGRTFYSPVIMNGFAKSFWTGVLIRNIVTENDDGSTSTETQRIEKKNDSVNSTQSQIWIVDEFDPVPIYPPSDNAVILGLNPTGTLQTARIDRPQNEFLEDVAASSGVNVFWQLVGVSNVDYGKWREYTVNYQATAIGTATTNG
jgi:hypothetical protein